MMSKSFLEAVKARRTYYGITNEAVTSKKEISELVEFAVKHTPSAFNSQSARAVVLLEEQHNKFWDLTLDILRGIVSGDQLQATEQRIAGFRGGYGTILFFEDSAVIEGLQQAMPTYAAKFPIWSGNSSGMLQYVIWTALEDAGYGASLQHYDPLVDEAVQKEWDVPANWKLQAQLVFGKPVAEPGEKEFQPIDARVKVYE
ncbi:nitroreductase family protein [Paenibacillus sp. IB182496]|uniref:Nitroreductase family protein n=1 Tax=Paenibacillus sabuli TaxID=2772509 RepID=A0A927BWM7_9BACL|nr:nitroreductase family protein [Paenibacillus sabuli]MBD2846713.1 nitroreductase family protein [Paenibacillus sabuli]